MQRRLSLGRLLLQSPKILLLDEPYNSFDRQGVQLVNEVVLAVRDAGGCALIVLHDRHIAEGILDRVVRLRQGLTDSPPMGGAPEARVIHDVAGATA
jgi:ABC-type sulfate/molybdate transport systems ATPase subunit